MGFLLKMFGGGAAKFWIAGIIIAAVGGYIGWLKWDIHSLETDVAKLEKTVIERDLEIVRLNGQIKECNTKVEQTNERIADLQDDLKAREKSFDLLVDNINLIKAGTEKEIADIRNAPTPATCQAAFELLRDGIGPIEPLTPLEDME